MEDEYIPRFEQHLSLFIPDKCEKYQDGKPLWARWPIKLGQNKLFFTTLNFLIGIDQSPANIIYVGAATGTNLFLIARDLYPQHNYILYDCNKFSKLLYSLHNVKICSRLFEMEECINISKGIYPKDIASCFDEPRKLYFISDIRTGSTETHEKEDIPKNMEMQKEWCQILQPEYAFLKCRLPWSTGKTKYLKGSFMLQTREGYSSTETRLITNCRELYEYDNDEYNNKIFYFQKNCRCAYYEFDIEPFKKYGICNCYDCWAEMYILRKYCARRQIAPANNFIKYILSELYEKKYLRSLDIAPHNMMVGERDIMKKLLALEEHSVQFYAKNMEMRETHLKTITPSDGYKVYICIDGELQLPDTAHIYCEKKEGLKYKVDLLKSEVLSLNETIFVKNEIK